jgi:hypothetical protein
MQRLEPLSPPRKSKRLSPPREAAAAKFIEQPDAVVIGDDHDRIGYLVFAVLV